MSYEFYKVLHILGLIITFSGLAGLLTLSMNRSEALATVRKFTAIAHGLGLLILLVAGFGLAAKLGLFKEFPLWVWMKIGIWILVGGVSAFIKRKPKLALLLYGVVILLGTCAAYLAVYKPFSVLIE